MFQRLSLKVKMFSAFSVLSCFLLIVAGVSNYFTHVMSDSYAKISDEMLPALEHLSDMRVAIQESLYLIVQSSLPTNDQKEFDRLSGKLDDAFAKYEKANDVFKKMLSESDQKQMELYKNLNDGYAGIRKYIEEGRVKLKPLTAEARLDFSQSYGGDFGKARQAFYKNLGAFVEFEKEQIETYRAEAAHFDGVGKTASRSAAVIGFILSMVAGFALSQSISKSLQKTMDLLTDSSSHVSSVSENIASASSQLSGSTTEQASALQETVSSLHEVSSMVNENAQNSQKSQEISEQSKEVAFEGKRVVTEMIQSMEQINQSNQQIKQKIDESNHEIAQIVQVIKEIGNKTKVINDIVFQTKLLSFNASVEAARAGENGKGFAVVAEEVGNLATMSGNAAKEISDLLSGSIQKVDQIVDNTRSSVQSIMSVSEQKVALGVQTAQRCEAVLDDMVQKVDTVNQMIVQISKASQEQSLGVNEISSAMNQIDQASQQNMVSLQHTTHAAATLRSQVLQLNEVIHGLNSTVNGEDKAA